jgi:hypothetical protein
MLKKSLILLVFLITTNSFASTCPNGFNVINRGNTVDEILQLCGPPSKPPHTYKLAASVPQEWLYYIPANSTDPSQGSVKMSVVFLNDKVTNITVNSQSLINTGLCGASTNVNDTSKSIKTSDSMQTVKTACGAPSFINKGQAQDNAPDGPQITELEYNGASSVILVFENNKLTTSK